MNEQDEKLRLALSIISGRRKYLDDDECLAIGYDPYSFSVYGKSNTESEMIAKAEDIIFDAIMEGRKK